MKVVIKKEIQDFLAQTATIIKDSEETYYYIPFYFKEVKGNLEVFDLLRRRDLPKHLFGYLNLKEHTSGNVVNIDYTKENTELSASWKSKPIIVSQGHQPDVRLLDEIEMFPRSTNYEGI